MEIIKVISEHKGRPHQRKAGNGRPAYTPPALGMRRVMATVREGRKVVTRHVDIASL